MLMRKLFIILSFLLLPSSFAQEPKYIVLSPEECAQVSTYVMLEIFKAQGRFKDKDPHASQGYTANAIIVGKKTVEANQPLEQFDPFQTWVELTQACANAEGHTSVPEGI